MKLVETEKAYLTIQRASYTLAGFVFICCTGCKSIPNKMDAATLERDFERISAISGVYSEPKADPQSTYIFCKDGTFKKPVSSIVSPDYYWLIKDNGDIIVVSDHPLLVQRQEVIYVSIKPLKSAAQGQNHSEPYELSLEWPNSGVVGCFTFFLPKKRRYTVLKKSAETAEYRKWCS